MENPIMNKVVYLATPKRLYGSSYLLNACEYIYQLEPKQVIDASQLFKSNEEWLKVFPHYLNDCEVMVIVTDNGIVGKGVYVEYEDFLQRLLPIYVYIEGNEKYKQHLTEVKSLKIINKNDWTNFAKIRFYIE